LVTTDNREPTTSDYLAARRAQIDRVLDEHLPSADTPPQSIHEAMRYAVLGGGKRIRPILAIAAAEACGTDPEPMLQHFAALELMGAADEDETISELASRMPADNPWRDALIAIADGRFGDAAEVFDGIGSLPLAAQARMIAAERGAPAASPAADTSRSRASRSARARLSRRA